MDATTELRIALQNIIVSTEHLLTAVRELQQVIAVDDHERTQWLDEQQAEDLKRQQQAEDLKRRGTDLLRSPKP